MFEPVTSWDLFIGLPLGSLSRVPLGNVSGNAPGNFE